MCLRARVFSYLLNSRYYAGALTGEMKKKRKELNRIEKNFEAKGKAKGRSMSSQCDERVQVRRGRLRENLDDVFDQLAAHCDGGSNCQKIATLFI